MSKPRTELSFRIYGAPVETVQNHYYPSFFQELYIESTYFDELTGLQNTTNPIYIPLFLFFANPGSTIRTILADLTSEINPSAKLINHLACAALGTRQKLLENPTYAQAPIVPLVFRFQLLLSDPIEATALREAREGSVSTRGCESSKEGEECCICLQGFGDDDDEVLGLACSHVYHTKCIAEWRKESSLCPLCRRYVIY